MLIDRILTAPEYLQVRLRDDVNSIVVQVANEYCDVEVKNGKQATKCRDKFRGFLRGVLIRLQIDTTASTRALSQAISELCAAGSARSGILVQCPFSVLMCLGLKKKELRKGSRKAFRCTKRSASRRGNVL